MNPNGNYHNGQRADRYSSGYTPEARDQGGDADRIELDEKAKQIILKPITRETIHAMRGKYRDTASLQALTEDRKWEKDRYSPLSPKWSFSTHGL